MNGTSPFPNYRTGQNMMNHRLKGMPMRLKNMGNGFYRQVPLHRAPWNERFYLSSVMNNAKPHKYFREYFDKPMFHK